MNRDQNSIHTAKKSVKRSFAGSFSKTANDLTLSIAKKSIAAGHDPEIVRQSTGWHQGVDSKWRFEINDSDARLKPALKSLSSGGYDAKPIDSVSYRKNNDGTFELTLNPPNPKLTSDFVTLKGLSEAALRAVLPDDLSERVLRSEGEDDLIGDFLDAKRLKQSFQFEGFNALPLDQVLHHPALFAAYPSLCDVMIQVMPKLGINAELVTMENGEHVIRIGLGQQLSSLLHEIQHCIQMVEGFARGGRLMGADKNLPITVVNEITQLTTTADKISATNSNHCSDLYDQARKLRAQASSLRRETAIKQYLSLAGEVEARNTQTRHLLTDAQRQQSPPESTADVPISDLIVVFNGIEMESAPVPANAYVEKNSSEGARSSMSIRKTLQKAYGPLLGQLEDKGIVILAKTTNDVISLAARLRSVVNGTTVEFEQDNVRQSLSIRKRPECFPPNDTGNHCDHIIDVKRSVEGILLGFFDHSIGKSFLIEENLSSATAPGVLMHEVGIHMASEDWLQPLFKRAANLIQQGAGTPFFDRIIARMAQANETCEEEAAGYLTEAFENDRSNAPKTVSQWFSDFKASVRGWLFKKGVKIHAEDLTPADIAAVARSNSRGLANSAMRKLESEGNASKMPVASSDNEYPDRDLDELSNFGSPVDNHDRSIIRRPMGNG